MAHAQNIRVSNLHRTGLDNNIDTTASPTTNTYMSGADPVLKLTQNALDAEIAHLEERLAATKRARDNNEDAPPPPTVSAVTLNLESISRQQQSLHALLLLADSALPLGSFAFSSGLESYLAHQKLKQRLGGAVNGAPPTQHAHFLTFLRLSIQSLAGTALPFVLAAFKEPHRLTEWDDTFDAITICNVARRASIAQGKGLLGVWARSFAASFGTFDAKKGTIDGRSAAMSTLQTFQASMRPVTAKEDVSQDDWGIDMAIPSGHYPPLWGAVTLLLGLAARDSVYLFLFSHLRTIASSAVRAGVLGPYQAQTVLSSPDVRKVIAESMEGMDARKVDDAAQVVPVMDLWMGRHEMLYSRIFNS